MSSLRQHLPHTILGAISLTTVVVYWVGLNGPFLLDDPPNLDGLGLWLEHKLALHTLLFERAGGMFGRPLSMATFALNAWIGGYSPFSLKVGNLVVHLLCGLMAFVLLRRLLRHVPKMASHAALYAAIVASIWLLHPLHASTVLYAVQRMAQLSTLIILFGLWWYLVFRDRLQRGASATATSGILLGIPIVTTLAFLAKENGALLPLLCAVMELTIFARLARPAVVRAFLLMYVVAPISAGLLLFAMQPERITGGYVSRTFDLPERLLTQGRVLCDYAFKLLVPNPPRMGIYTDDFPVSTSLLSPVSTLTSLLFLVMASLAAWHFRKRFPAVAFGWFFFLAAHALEAGPISLELYFEHRNYLPSVGIFIVIMALAHAAGQRLALAGLRPRRIGAATLAATLLVLAFGTHGRARVWQDRLLIAESSLAARPDSLRANVEVFSNSLDHGNRKRAEEIVAALSKSSVPRNRARAHIYRLFLQCTIDHEGDPHDLEQFVKTTPMPLNIEESMPFRGILNAIADGGCGRVSAPLVGTGIARLVDRAHAQSDESRQKIVLRYYAAEAHLMTKDWRAALPQARLAWQSYTEPALARPLVMSQLMMGDFDGAEATWQEAHARREDSNTADTEALGWLRSQIDDARQAKATRRQSKPK